ncbi:hypothetical protein AVEN_95059-1, partial [Araneus ventricosus]
MARTTPELAPPAHDFTCNRPIHDGSSVEFPTWNPPAPKPRLGHSGLHTAYANVIISASMLIAIFHIAFEL